MSSEQTTLVLPRLAAAQILEQLRSGPFTACPVSASSSLSLNIPADNRQCVISNRDRRTPRPICASSWRALGISGETDSYTECIVIHGASVTSPGPRPLPYRVLCRVSARVRMTCESGQCSLCTKSLRGSDCRHSHSRRLRVLDGKLARHPQDAPSLATSSQPRACLWLPANFIDASP